VSGIFVNSFQLHVLGQTAFLMSVETEVLKPSQVPQLDFLAPLMNCTN